MEKHLSKIASSLHNYMLCLDSIRETNKEIEAQERMEWNKYKAYLKKFTPIKKQLIAYRDTINSTIDIINIALRLETKDHAQYILDENNRPPDHFLLAIAPKNSRILYWRKCNFLAICGDYAKNEIQVYSFTEEVHKKDYLYDRAKRLEFQKHTPILHKQPIDQFDFEAVRPFITALLYTELNYLTYSLNPAYVLHLINSIEWKNT